MALKIKKKANIGKKLAVFTILGMVGERDDAKKASYYFEKQESKKEDYFNTLPLLIKNFQDKNYKIIPIYTVESKKANEKVLEKSGYSIDFDESYLIQDEKNFNEIFSLLDSSFEEYDEIIVDVSHGFRHLPILMIVDLIIKNFQDVKKIKKILFAKEIKQYCEYEIIDLKEYLDIANISFILTNFNKNFTVANHISSKKYQSLVDALNEFSNDIMALSLNNLYEKSSNKLLIELEKIDNIGIYKQSQDLKNYLENIIVYNGKKRYQTYLDLSKTLFEKNYMLLSLSLLYESIRLYIKTKIKSQQIEIVKKIENYYDNDLYKIGDFFIKFKNDKFSFDNFNKECKNATPITRIEFNTFKALFPQKLIEEKKFNVSNNKQNIIDAIAYTRNNLAHGNVKGNFKNIQKDIKELISEYEKSINQ